MSFQSSNKVLPAGLLILFAALTRLFPHYPNFTALGAMALFSGTVIADKKIAYLFPLAALLLSDLCLQLFTSTKGFYGNEQYFIYASFLLITMLSSLIKRKNITNLALACVWSGIVFFITSNFGVWLLGAYYPKTASGLAASYLSAIPFYKGEFFGSFFLNVIYSNFFFSALLFGAYYFIERRQLVQSKA